MRAIIGISRKMRNEPTQNVLHEHLNMVIYAFKCIRET